MSNIAMDDSADFWVEVDESSVGDMVTADDGYDADVEVFVKNQQGISSKRISQLAGTTEIIKGSINADPALCSLSIDLLIYFYHQ